MASSIALENVEVRRGSFVLRDINLQIAPREVFAILGQTGSGKTILLDSLAGAFALDEGQISIDGNDVSDIPADQRHMGIVYQDYALFPHMDVYDNVAYGLKRHKVGKDEIDRRVRSMLDRFDIGYLADRFPGVISGGEAQRVALSRALVLQPDILLLDEPFSALDPATKNRMYGTFREIHQSFDCTIVFVTHDFHEAQTLADRVGIVLGGRLRAVVESSRLFDDDYDDDVSYFLGKPQTAADDQSKRFVHKEATEC